ncbi:MAG TPA: tyrosine--tRNA ligase [Baekduia sp.]|uniref:tyrosine--tRNA ligase n=1 Tax=Baekduia sp. TaxID=2600305 RepID=UPI002D774609|nr:tyrosine--tRNA ligase [Baekduia sp.]HET6506010.1 tyrosine--tRNA ligase [Baekduia sp.]
MAPADDLLRNAHQSLPEGGLARKLEIAENEGRQLRVKLGLDPTAPDIHLGHTVVLQKLREFQDLGHRVVLIVGDYTARVGDPSGRSSTRPVLSPEDIDANAETYKDQAFTILRDDPELLEVRRNGEWLNMPAADLFALARVATVAQILERDDFAKRFAAQQPISVLETLYPLLQGYDSVAIRSDVELGGTDQTFNLLLGRDVQRAYGQPEQVILTMPILPGIDGTEKMSKSLGNHVGVTEPADEQFGKTMRLPDAAMDTWFELLALDDPGAGAGPRDRKRALARGVVARFHGEEAAQAAERRFDALFVSHAVPDDVEDYAVESDDGASVHLPALIAAAFGRSRSEARRLLEQGGVRLDGEVVASDAFDLPLDSLDGRVLQVGKRHFRRLVAASRTA